MKRTKTLPRIERESAERKIMNEKKFSIKEMWDLQEKLLDDPRLPDMLEVVGTFPKPKSGSVSSPEEHLINIVFGFYMEQEAMEALKERGYYTTFIDVNHHLEIAPMPKYFMRKNDLICDGKEYDVKVWHSQFAYTHPRYVSSKPTMDLVLRKYGMASLYFTGVRTMDNAEEVANGALHFEFKPKDPRIFDYQNRMRAQLAKRGLF